MSDKTKMSATASKTAIKPKKPATITSATSSRTKIVPKEKNVVRPKKCSPNPNATTFDADTTVLKSELPGLPDFDNENRQIAYGKFLRAMLEECLIDEKIEREETVMDIQMAQMAERFKQTMDQLDKTSRRLKDISFVVEQKRLLDLKSNDCSKFYKMTENSNTESLLQDLSSTEEAHLNKIELKNVDFGYDKVSGHKQLLDAVSDAIEGLEKIKKESNLDMEKFKQYELSKINVEEIEQDKFDLESLKTEFEGKFPQFSERLLKEASEKIARMLEMDENEENTEDLS